MKAKDLLEILKEIGSVAFNRLPEILVPVTPYGKTIETIVKIGKEGIGQYEKRKLEQLREEAKEEIKNEATQLTPVNYMDCVLFTCKKGQVLTQEQQENLTLILQQEFISDDEESLILINEFINQYMGGHIEVDNVDAYSIGNDYISFNFSDNWGLDEYPYDEEDIKLIMKALNRLLGMEIFDFYVVSGHMESWNE